MANYVVTAKMEYLYRARGKEKSSLSYFLLGVIEIAS